MNEYPKQEEGLVSHVVSQTRELVQDLTEWVSLKMEYTRLNMEVRMNQRLNQVMAQAMAGSVWLLALIFASVALALGLGVLLGHAAWGFLVVSAGYALVGGYFWWRRPRVVQVSLPPIGKKGEEAHASVRGTVEGSRTTSGTETGGDRAAPEGN